MCEKPTISDIDLDILLTAHEVPHSVQVVLRKVELAELGRAKRDIAERLQVILNSVNKALYRMRLGTAVEEEEDDVQQTALQQQKEKKKRSQKLEAIRTFLQSSLDKESDLSVVLQWLTDMHQELEELEDDEDIQEVEEITEEWVEEMQDKIHMSMSDIQECIVRLHQLCGSLFELETKKTKKKETADNKGGVWRWWRESKVDGRTILRIQELHPPAVDRILMDVNLGTKAASDLAFMLGDMAKFLSCNKAMSMAFKFVQTGLHNLNDALQERTREAHKMQAQMDELKAKDCNALLADTKMELEGGKRRLTKLEAENYGLKEENAAALFQIHKLQEALHSYGGAPIIEVVEQVMEFPYPPSQPPPSSPSVPAKPKLRKGPPPPPPPKKQTPKEAPVVVESDQPKSFPMASPEPEPPEVDEVDEVEEEVEESPPPTPESVAEVEVKPDPSPNELDIFQAMEEKSTGLLDNFQSSVFKIIETSLSVKPGASAGGMAGQLQGMGLDVDKANDVIKLYISLQKTIRDSFSKLTSKVHGKFTDSILEMPFIDDDLEKVGFWDDSKKNPGDMLRDINKMFISHDHDIESAGSSVRMLMKDSKKAGKKGFRRRVSLPELLSQLKNINDMSKQQACKMRLALESLLDMHKQMQKEPRTEEKIAEEPEGPEEQPSTSRVSMPSSDSYEEEEEVRVEEKRPRRHPERPVKVEKRVRKSPMMPQKPKKTQRLRLRECPVLKEDLDRYKMEIEEEGERIEKTVMAGATFQVSVATQRTNLRQLREAAMSGDISTELYGMAKHLVTQTLDTDKKRLACLLRKFIAFRSLQQVRYNLNMQLLAARELNDGQTVRDMYIFLTKLDVYEKRMLDRWRAKQANIEHRRRTCFARMLYLFSEIRQDCNLHLLTPFTCPSEGHAHFVSIQPRRPIWSMGPRHRHRPRPPPAQPTHHPTPVNEASALSGIRELRGQLPALWRCDMTMNSMQLGRKVPAFPTTVPSFPLLLEMDINHTRNTALRSAQARMAGGQWLLGRGDV